MLPVAAPVPPQAAAAAAATRARAFFDGLGVTAAEGNGPVELRLDPTQKDAAYRANLTLNGPGGKPLFADEHVLLGNDPFTDRPFTGAPDIVFHELTHRVTQHVVPGFGQTPASRVVDESLADTFAAAIDGNWTIGEGILPGGIRSLEHPSTQQMLDGAERVAVRTPTKFEDVTSSSMARGPYFNMGPLNHAAYLVGTSLGTDPMARIYLQALRHHLQPESGMTDLVLGTVRGAGELYGAGSREQAAVRDAWKAVGVRAAAVDAI
jgi:Zn-dependent metalloprotease